MDYAYTYGSRDRVYLNVTNRCTNRCTFCVGRHQEGLGSGQLRGNDEPGGEEVLAAVDRLAAGHAINEVIWCGFGEPTFRLDLILQLSPLFRSRGLGVRLNTNGQGCLIQDRDILPDLGKVLDEVNISLNAPDEETYLRLCRPDPDQLGRRHPPLTPGDHWRACLDFLRRAPQYLGQVQASVVGGALAGSERVRCRQLSRDLGVHTFRIR